MRARPIRTRAELLELVSRHAPTKACATAMHERRSTVLGGFTPSKGFPCWMVEVVSRRGSRWIIAVECDEERYEFKIKYLDSVPWESWAGRASGLNPLIDGDRPVESALKRLNARR